MHRHSPRVLLTSWLVLLVLAPVPARAQGSKVQAATARRAVAVHRALHDTLQAILDRAVADSAFPGAVAMIGNRFGPIATVTAGRIDWAPGSPPPTASTIWDLASLTKVVGMTSAMMQLVERGRIDLDAPVQRYLPEWTGRWKERVTVRDLVTHRSGLPAFRQYFKLNLPPDSTLALQMNTALDTFPRVRMVYSDIGAIVAGKVIERVSGQRLDAYLAQHVFGPLGMTDTRYLPPAALRPRIAPTEVDPWRGRHLRGEVHDENAAALGGISAHAGLFSTAHDLDRLARAYLDGGRLGTARLAGPRTIRRFTTVADSTFSNRALGWDTPPGAGSGRFLRRPAFGHTGFTGTSLWIAPQHDLYVMLLTNRVNPTRERSRIPAVRTAVAEAAMRLLHPKVVSTLEARAASASSTSPTRP
jgi:CubicO group peptidase (beta-lactamase class C family)